MSLLIFLPRASGANLDNLRAVGLESLLRSHDANPSFSDLPGTGPGGLPGQMVFWLEPGAQELGYHPDRQTWVPAVPDNARKLVAGRYWVGWSQDTPPGPQQLVRRDLLPGPGRRLGDGQIWQIPNLMTLPQTIGLDAGGVPVRRPQPEFEGLVKLLAEPFQRCLEIAGGTGAAPLEWFRLVVEILSWNYRVVPELANALGLVREEDLFGVVAMASDTERVRAVIEQRKNGDGPRTPPG